MAGPSRPWPITISGIRPTRCPTAPSSARAIRSARRAAAADLISRWGAIDPSDGGKTGRYSLDADWHLHRRQFPHTCHAYGLYYDLNLFSELHLFPQRSGAWRPDRAAGQSLCLRRHGSPMLGHTLFGDESETTFGLQVRNDDIRNGLFHTEQRHGFRLTTSNDIDETSAQPLCREPDPLDALAAHHHWPARRTYYMFDVHNIAGGNSGDAQPAVLEPQGQHRFSGPGQKTEFYLDFGQGFHSNDARGVVAAADPATPLPRSTGGEFGVRTTRSFPICTANCPSGCWTCNRNWSGTAMRATTSPAGPTRRYRRRVRQLVHAHRLADDRCRLCLVACPLHRP